MCCTFRNLFLCVIYALYLQFQRIAQRFISPGLLQAACTPSVQTTATRLKFTAIRLLIEGGGRSFKGDWMDPWIFTSAGKNIRMALDALTESFGWVWIKSIVWQVSLPMCSVWIGKILLRQPLMQFTITLWWKMKARIINWNSEFIQVGMTQLKFDV